MPDIRPYLLDGMPKAMKSAPVSAKGFPVPWFVSKDASGEWDFHVLHPTKYEKAIAYGLCWITGVPLGAYRSFVGGPLTGLQLAAAEPPSSLQAAEWAVRVCPYMVNAAHRSKRTHFGEKPSAHPSNRSRGLSAIWTARAADVHLVQGTSDGSPQFFTQKPTRFTCFRNGKALDFAGFVEAAEDALDLYEDTSDEFTSNRLRAAYAAHLPVIQRVYTVP